MVELLATLSLLELGGGSDEASLLALEEISSLLEEEVSLEEEPLPAQINSPHAIGHPSTTVGGPAVQPSGRTIGQATGSQGGGVELEELDGNPLLSHEPERSPASRYVCRSSAGIVIVVGVSLSGS